MKVQSKAIFNGFSRRVLFPALLLALFANSAPAQQHDTPQPAAPYASAQPVPQIIEKEFYVPASGANPPGLDVLEVYFNSLGKHPLAVLTHGTSDDPLVRAHVTPWGQQSQAQWFARRGYVVLVVVRSGYGRSGGKQDSSHGGCGSRVGSFEEAGEASVADLAAVMRYAATLPEVDASTIISTGVSTGGFAQVALSANPPPGLKAAISFAGGRGGDGHEHNCDLGGIVGAFGSFGKSAHKHGDLPMLWIYSQNDHWFPPAMAQKFEEAYTKSGATNQFVMAPPDGDDGHHLYAHVAAWSDTVEAFLKAHSLLPLGDTVLPAPQPPNVPMPTGFQAQDQDTWNRFLLAAPYKALVRDASGKLWIGAAAFDQGLADEAAKDRCKKGGGSRCEVIARTPGVK
jgi:dienelactone hydrolase